MFHNRVRDGVAVVPKKLGHQDSILVINFNINFFSKSDFYKLHNQIKEKLQNKNIFFDDVNYCPYHPKAKLKKYRKKTELRKPGNLMIRQIKKKWHIKYGKSFMIGDKISDKICAKKSKLYFEFAEKNFLNQIKRITKRS